MTFIKGHKGFRTKESYNNPVLLAKLRDYKLGTHLSDETKQKMSVSHKGKLHGPMSIEQKRKISEARKGKAMGNRNCIGRTPWNKGKVGVMPEPWNKGTKGVVVSWNKGKKCPEISIRQLGKKLPQNMGENNVNWRGGVTPENEKARKSLQYKMWRRQVFERDDYTCQMCGERGGVLHADHDLPFSLFQDLRFELLNGQTLCVSCHRNRDTTTNRNCLERMHMFNIQLV